MSTTVNKGSQTINVDFKQQLKGSYFSQQLYTLIKPGVYSGLDVTRTVPNDNKINISPGQVFLHCLFQGETKRAIKAQFASQVIAEPIPQSATGVDELVYLIYEYKEIQENWVKIAHCSANDSVPTNGIIIARCIYDSNGFIDSISYEDRQFGFFNDDFTISDSNEFSNSLDSSKRFKLSASNLSSGTNEVKVIDIPNHNYSLNTLQNWSSGVNYIEQEIIVFNNTLFRNNTNHTSSISFYDDISYWDNITATIEEEIVRGYNNTGSILQKGKVVKVSGDNSSELIPEIDLINDYLNEPFGILINDINDSNSGELIQRGRIDLSSSYNFSSGSIGQKIYSDNTGSLTLTVTPLIVGQLLDPINSIIYVSILPAEEGLNTVNFNGQLSVNENSIQKAFDRLDDYGYIPIWETGKSYRVGNPIRRVDDSSNSIWVCITNHTSTSFTSNISNWVALTDSTALKIANVKNLTSANSNLSVSGGTGSTIENVVLTITDSPSFISVSGQNLKTSEINIANSTLITTAGTINNVNVSNYSFIRVSGTSQITGIQAPTSNKLITISNISGSTLTIANNSGSSSSGNRIYTGLGSNLVLESNSSMSLIYDFTSSFWRVIGVTKITEAMQNLTDNTTNDVSTSRHGYVPKAPNDTSKFLNGAGAWSTPASSTPVGAEIFFDNSNPNTPALSSEYVQCNGQLISDASSPYKGKRIRNLNGATITGIKVTAIDDTAKTVTISTNDVYAILPGDSLSFDIAVPYAVVKSVNYSTGVIEVGDITLWSAGDFLLTTSSLVGITTLNTVGLKRFARGNSANTGGGGINTFQSFGMNQGASAYYVLGVGSGIAGGVGSYNVITTLYVDYFFANGYGTPRPAQDTQPNYFDGVWVKKIK